MACQTVKLFVDEWEEEDHLSIAFKERLVNLPLEFSRSCSTLDIPHLTAIVLRGRSMIKTMGRLLSESYHMAMNL